MPFGFEQNTIISLMTLVIVETIFASVILSILKKRNLHSGYSRLRARVVSVETLEGGRTDEAPAYAASVSFSFGGHRYEKELPVMTRTRPPEAGREMEILFDPKSGAAVAADEADTERTGLGIIFLIIGVNIFVLLAILFAFSYDSPEEHGAEFTFSLGTLLGLPLSGVGIYLLLRGCAAKRMKRSQKLRPTGGVFVGYRYCRDSDDDCDYTVNVYEYNCGGVTKRTESNVRHRAGEEPEEPDGRLIAFYKEYKAKTGRTLPEAEVLLQTKKLRPGDRVTLYLDEKTGRASDMSEEEGFVYSFVGVVLLAVGLTVSGLLSAVALFC